MLKFKQLYKSIAVLLLCLVIGGIGTYAWFVNFGAVNVNNSSSISIKSEIQVEIAMPRTGVTDPALLSYTNEIDISEYIDALDAASSGTTSGTTSGTQSGNPYAYLKANEYDDITGDGRYMYTPRMGNNNTPVVSNEDTGNYVTWFSESAGYKYSYIDVWVRTTASMSLYLNSESYVAPKTSATLPLFASGAASGTEIFNKSPDGAFSRNYIAAATRVAFASKTSDSDGDTYPNLIWVPNSTYELQNDGDGTVTFTTAGQKEDNYSYYIVEYENNEGIRSRERSSDSDKQLQLKQLVTRDGNGKLNAMSYADGESTKTTYWVEELQTTHGGFIGSEYPAMSINVGEGAGYGYGKLRITVWFEGEDREARASLTGGAITTKFQFIAQAEA